MTVTRFRSVEEMPDERWRPPGSPELGQAIKSVWDFASRTCPRHFPPGVHRYASVEALWAQEERWARADFDALWAARLSSDR